VGCRPTQEYSFVWGVGQIKLPKWANSEYRNHQEALNEVRVLSGLLPICASCKKIKDERDRWQPLEGYIQSRSEAKFTHGICPDCMRKLYPEYCL
jgi:hypothetical protein